MKKWIILILTLCLCLQLACITAAQADALEIITQPQNVTVASGKTAKVTVEAEGDGLKYQWYYAAEGSSKFAKASIQTATYSVKMDSTRAGRQLYCIITDQYGNKEKTETVTLSMATPLKITAQPKDVTVLSGKTAKVTVKAQGDGLKYQWYYAAKSSSKFAKASIKTASYSVTMNSTRAGRKVYCVITDKYGNKVTTNTVTLGMQTPLKIKTQPKDVTVLSGKTAKVTVTAQGDGLTYRWYYKDIGMSSFKKSTVTSAAYSVTMNNDRDGRQVYCVVTDKYGSKLQSNTVTLQRPFPIRITLQPVDVATYDGMDIELAVSAEGEGLTYRWYYANKGSSKFAKTSGTAATYTVAMTSARNGRRMYCLITDKYGQKTKSDVITISQLNYAYIPDGLTYQQIDSLTNEYIITDYTGSATNLVVPSSIGGTPVTAIDMSAFSRCDSLRTVTLPDSIRSIYSSAFYDCTNLRSITLPKNLTFLDAHVFQDCSSLQHITIPSGVTAIKDATFNRCSSLTDISLPDGITSIGDGAFDGCSSLAEISLPNSLTSIGTYAFSGCSSLTSIKIPAGVVSIGDYAFWISGLTSITLSEGLQIIDDGAFYFLALDDLTIPASVTTIGKDAFAGLPNINVYNKSYAHQYCLENELPFTIIK